MARVAQQEGSRAGFQYSVPPENLLLITCCAAVQSTDPGVLGPTGKASRERLNIQAMRIYKCSLVQMRKQAQGIGPKWDP